MLSALILPSGPSEQVLEKMYCSIFTSSFTQQQSSAKSGFFLSLVIMFYKVSVACVFALSEDYIKYSRTLCSGVQWI